MVAHKQLFFSNLYFVLVVFGGGVTSDGCRAFRTFILPVCADIKHFCYFCSGARRHTRCS
ncbi:MAG: hypothetical protein LBK18_08660 [Prevotellaceae bacterium]|nr:hypothetical protein [Prevotellaceae bacterium]